MNVNGIENKADRIQQDRKIAMIKTQIDENNINLIFLQELKIHHDGGKVGIKWKKYFPDFNFISDNYIETGFLIHKNVQYHEVDKGKVFVGGNLWVTWIVVHSGGKQFLCASLYRSPSKRASKWNKTKHLANISDINRELKYLKNKTKCNGIIIAGDFNLASNLWDVRYNKQNSNSTNNLMDFMDENNLTCINNRELATHCKYENIDGIPTITKYNNIDLVLMSRDLVNKCSDFKTNSFNVYDGSDTGNDVINSELDAEWVSTVSDHFLVQWNINYKLRENDGLKETWRLNSENWNNYRNVLDASMRIWYNQYIDGEYRNMKGTELIDVLSDRLAKAIRSSANVTIGRKKFDERSKPWMNREYINMINLCKKYRRKIHELKSKSKYEKWKLKNLKMKYNEYKRIKIKIRNISIKLWYNNVGRDINNCIDDSKIVFANYNCLEYRKTDLPPFKKNDDTYTDETNEKAKMMHDHFTRNRKENVYSDDVKRYHGLVDDLMENEYIQNEDNEQKDGGINETITFLNRTISEQEIWKAIKTLKRKNAMGCDQIHNVMILEGIEVLMPYLVILFNLILKHGYHPFLWKLSESTGMGKPGKDASNIKNIRNLQLTPTLSRIYEKVMVWRLLTYFKINNFFNPNNVAYQGNKSINDIFMDIDESIGEILESKGILEKLDFDLSSAFDTVWINHLLYKLKFIY